MGKLKGYVAPYQYGSGMDPYGADPSPKRQKKQRNNDKRGKKPSRMALLKQNGPC